MAVFCYTVFMYDDEDGDDDEDEIDIAKDAETLRREEAEVSRGKSDRAFYDNLAKTEDERHNAMRVDMQKRSLAVGELRQKLRHKEADMRMLEMKITSEEDIIDYEKKKKYRSGASGVSAIPGEAVAAQPIPILTKDIDPKDGGEEFSVERAEAHIKQLQSEKMEFEKHLREMRENLNEEERALSQLQHQLMRM